MFCDLVLLRLLTLICMYPSLTEYCESGDTVESRTHTYERKQFYVLLPFVIVGDLRIEYGTCLVDGSCAVRCAYCGPVGG